MCFCFTLANAYTNKLSGNNSLIVERADLSYYVPEIRLNCYFYNTISSFAFWIYFYSWLFWAGFNFHEFQLSQAVCDQGVSEKSRSLCSRHTSIKLLLLLPPHQCFIYSQLLNVQFQYSKTLISFADEVKKVKKNNSRLENKERKWHANGCPPLFYTCSFLPLSLWRELIRHSEWFSDFLYYSHFYWSIVFKPKFRVKSFFI